MGERLDLPGDVVLNLVVTRLRISAQGPVRFWHERPLRVYLVKVDFGWLSMLGPKDWKWLSLRIEILVCLLEDSVALSGAAILEIERLADELVQTHWIEYPV